MIEYCSLRVSGYMLTHKTSSRWRCSNILLGVSALHYSTRSWNLEGVWMVASAHALCQPTIVHPSISIISIWKFRIKLELSIALTDMSIEFIINLGVFPIVWKLEFGTSE